MSDRITVYTTGPECQQCRLTKKWLADRGVKFTEVRLDLHPERAAEFAERQFAIAPVVHVQRGDGGDVWWSGFRVTSLKALIHAAVAL